MLTESTACSGATRTTRTHQSVHLCGHPPRWNRLAARQPATRSSHGALRKHDCKAKALRRRCNTLRPFRFRRAMASQSACESKPIADWVPQGDSRVSAPRGDGAAVFAGLREPSQSWHMMKCDKNSPPQSDSPRHAFRRPAQDAAEEQAGRVPSVPRSWARL